MFDQRTPYWILFGGFTLTCIAGMVNAVGFLGAYHEAFSHLSGTTTFLSADLVAGRYHQALHAALLMLAFFGGATLSGLVIRDSHLKAGRRYGVALTMEAVLLLSAVPLLEARQIWGSVCAAAACGLQNAMATTYSGAIVRTTHMTGIVTDLGLALSHWLRRRPSRGGRVRLLSSLLLGFLVGSGIGAALFQRFGYSALHYPGGLALAIGVSHFVHRHFWHRR